MSPATLVLSLSSYSWNCVINENNSNQNMWRRQSHVTILKPCLDIMCCITDITTKLAALIHVHTRNIFEEGRGLPSNLYSRPPLLSYLATNRLFMGVIIQMKFPYPKHNKKIPFSFVPANLQTPSGSGLIHYTTCSCLPLSLANKWWLIPAEVNKN